MNQSGPVIRRATNADVDALLNDGMDQVNYLIWAMQPNPDCLTCSLTSCSCGYPASDVRLFAPLELQ